MRSEHNDYYRLRAIFEPHQVRLDPVPGESDFEKGGLPVCSMMTFTQVPTCMFEPITGQSSPIAGVPSMLSASSTNQINQFATDGVFTSTRAHVLETRLANAKTRVESSRLQQIKAREEYKR